MKLFELMDGGSGQANLLNIRMCEAKSTETKTEETHNHSEGTRTLEKQEEKI
jgi:hypothetical protein